MKKNLLVPVCILMYSFNLNAQVTQINNNKSLHVTVPLNNTKTIVVSALDSSIWITDATLSGTFQISSGIKYESFGGLLSGKFIFRGRTAATGSEIYITDGTAGGTVLVKDIYSGASSSAPGDFSLLNGFIYFSAVTAAEGRELWRTNGTPVGTTLVKDIVPGTDSSNHINEYHLFSNGAYLLFAAQSASAGIELWKSDGTNAGTVLLKDINTGNSGADSSDPNNFYPFNNIVLFTATDATHGNEIWKTDGTPGGTVLLKDINPNAASSTSFELFPGLSFPLFLSFHIFNNRAYFNATDGVSLGEVWVTDGTSANTTLLKNIVTGTFPAVLLLDAVNLPGKFIFPVSDEASRSELWQSDGTPGGTVLFKSFSPITAGAIPEIFVPYSADPLNGSLIQPLFQGNKFFFTAGTMAEGYELWISDGTAAGTSMIKDIKMNTGDGIDIDNNVSYLYTTTALYFAANDGAHANELWKSDGTNAGTTMVADINPNAGDANPELAFICNGKIIFTATNGDDANATDLYAVDGTFISLPIILSNFTVTSLANDALLQWATSQEINTRDFTVQRSYDAQHFENIGVVKTGGTTSNGNAYTFTDAGIINSGKSIVYYRLLTSDIDGKSAYSNVISLKIRGNSQWNVRLLSNPVQDNVNILLSGISGKLQLSVRDISGKIIYTSTMQNINGLISLPAVFEKGIYVLIAETNKEIKTIKFVK